MTEIIISKPNELTTSLGYSLIDRKYSQITQIQRSRVIEYLQGLIGETTGPDFMVESGKEYRVKFPKWITEGLEAGVYAIREDKNGNSIAQIIDVTKPKKPLVYNLRIDEFIAKNPDRAKQIRNGISDMYIRHQLNDISQTLLSIQSSVSSVQRGLLTDRIALVVSGREQLEIALQLNETNPLKLDLVKGAIAFLSEGKAKLRGSLIDEFRSVTEIPKRQWRIAFNSLRYDNYHSKIINQYSSLQEGMYAYFEASRLLTISYTILDKTLDLKQIVESTVDLIQIGSPKMINLARLGESDRSKSYWYNDSDKIIQRLNNSSKLQLPEDIDFVSIDVSGDELMGGNINEQM